MLHTQQIEEAINHQLDSEHKNSGSGYVIMVDSKHYETLRFLAQEYLAIEGMPEERKHIAMLSNKQLAETGKLLECRTVDDWINYGFNQALSSAITQLQDYQKLRERVSVEKIDSLIRNYAFRHECNLGGGECCNVKKI